LPDFLSKTKNVTFKIFKSGKVYDIDEFANNSTEFLKPEQKEFVLRTTKSKRLFILLISHAFALVLILDSPNDFINSFFHFSFSTIFYSFFTIIALPITWYHYFDNKPKLTISNEGIWTKEKGLYVWGMIIQMSIHEVNFEGQKYYLILHVNYGNGDTEEIKTEITYLDKKPEVIAQIIENLKK